MSSSTITSTPSEASGQLEPSSTPPITPIALAVLAILTAVGPLAIDMYLPGFPGMAAELGTSASGIQLTMTAFLIGLAFGQLFIGPLSDTYGRRRPLLIGTVVCLIASAACALAPNVETLTIARLLQGVGGAAGVVLARAIITDVAKGSGAVKLLNVLAIIVVIAPVVGPLAGGGIIAASGWRAVFWVQVALVAIMTIGAVIWAKETLPAAQRSTGGIRETLQNAGQVLRNRQYVGYLLTFCLAFAGLFSYIAASPFVIQNILGMSEGTFSIIFAVNAVAITATSAASAALAGRAPLRRVVAIGLGLAVLFGLGILVTVLSGLPMIPTLILFFCFQGSLGFIFGNATALALREAGQFAGTGSAFLGFFQFILAAAVAPLVGIAGEDSAVPMVIAMVTFAVLAALAFVTLTRRSADDE